MTGKFTVWSSAMMKIPSSASEKMARCVKARTSVAQSFLLILLRKVKKICVCVCVFVGVCVRVCACMQFIQWNIHRCGVKQSEQILPQDATGPFVLSGYSGYKQVSRPAG